MSIITVHTHSADCHLVLLLLGQMGGRLPCHDYQPEEPSQHVAHTP